MAASAGVASAATAMIGNAAWGVRKPAARRVEVVEPLFAHGAADGMGLQLRSRHCRCGMPGRTDVALPGAGRVLAIDVSVSAAVKVVWREWPRRCGCWRNVRVRVGWFKPAWRYRRLRNMGVKIAVVGAVVLNTIMVKGMA